MSFAREVKEELSRLPLEPICLPAELAAIARLSAHIEAHDETESVIFYTENAAIARRIYMAARELFGPVGEVSARKNMRLKKNNTYGIRLHVPPEKIAKTLGLTYEQGARAFSGPLHSALTAAEDCTRAYLRGAFLSRGSVNAPSSASYHLELMARDEAHALEIQTHLNRFALEGKILQRKRGWIVYFKEGEKITSFLNLIGAHRALFRFEDARIVKDMRNTVNRLVNCETANLNKTVQAALEQVRDIELIDARLGLSVLSPKLREVAEARLKYPEATLSELGVLIKPRPLSKSTVNHRLRKIRKLADRLRQ
ncbi:MAG: hypothetical protein BSOLF_1917 [Candidatus Carbobacillus altaicus]|uniref:Probable cell division protein WhiA n=1 Tax=Candidatus Carbonibacillus altaicus TaxID=2163959 RepID=A0A2R6XYN6_9BACL|nr:MAG: hypothetical protein BSOLF_1917 [Candidatus Carbobacillus altaicus]